MATGYTASDQTATATRFAEGNDVAEHRDGVTVITTDSNSWLGRGKEGPRAKAEIIAVGPDGAVQYYNDSHTRYWDVDPVAGTEMTVEYVAADHLTPEQCGGETVCTRNVVERVNLSTGETERVFSRVTEGKHSTRWHDADRIDEDHVVVADIAKDRVFVVNTTTGLTTWAWSAQSEFETDESGGPYPEDWTHINDVEVLSDGRIMVSIRNHDQVVFLDRETGMLENQTLGSDGDHETLYEQHNPDYIPESEGGPAAIVADSENGRVVEYQRTDGEWERSWTWRDGRLQWPRDADRLPNGHTLVTDSNGNRVVEVDENGEVVWSMDVAFPYEAERLNTGDESSGGPSAQRAGLQSETADGDEAGATATDTAGVFGAVFGVIEGLLGSTVVNAVMYVLPVWAGGPEVAAVVVAVGALVAWAGVELYWSSWRPSVDHRITIEQRD
ncbi:aryl-sulfate sulfotransferase [Haloarcula rubra]|uniref:aryl-sulfate sulfotransferase n=1 Tax=Haloarcula rubra TaxID=2487747 RepID=UPI002E2DABCC|nr:aryl-sulfate sulfotransferase [Halomicroarcula rubra]